MNDDELFRPEGDVRSSAAKSSGCGWKFLLILLAVTGGVSLLCCCGIGISMYSMVPNIVEDPAQAEIALKEILTLDLPDGFRPKVAVSMNLLGFMRVRGVVVEAGEQQGMMIVVRLQGAMVQQGNVVQQIEEAIRQETKQADMVIESTESRSFEIEGQQVEFLFMKGRLAQGAAVKAVELQEEEPAPVDPPREAPAEDQAEQPNPPAERGMYQVRAMIPTADGPVLFLLILDEKEWNEDDVVRMIESIQLP